MNKRQISINMLSGLTSGLVTLMINFFLTPYLVKNVGDEAYGYIGLSNNFIMVATLFTTALNSMANRFIIGAYEKRDFAKVNVYYSSLFVFDGILALLFLCVGLIVAGRIEYIFNVSAALLPAVKLTFIISIINFSVISLLTVFGNSPFITNRLDLSAKADILANVVKILLVLLLFSFFDAQIYFVTLGGLAYTLVLYLNHLINTRKLLPDLRIKISFARLSTAKELVVSGVWNSLDSLNSILTSGLDLAMANWLLGGQVMGLLAIVNSITLALNTLLIAVTNAFKPTLAQTFFNSDVSVFHQQMKVSNRVQCALLAVPMAGICIFAPHFYRLWMPYQESSDIQILAAITFVKIFEQYIGLTTDSMRNLFYLKNNLRKNAFCRLLCGIVNIPLVIIGVKLTQDYFWRIFIVSGLSSIIYIFYYWIAVPVLSSSMMKMSVKEYYKMIFHTMVIFLAVLGVYTLAENMFSMATWLDFIVIVAGLGMLGYFLMALIASTREEKRKIIKNIIDKLR